MLTLDVELGVKKHMGEPPSLLEGHVEPGRVISIGSLFKFLGTQRQDVDRDRDENLPSSVDAPLAPLARKRILHSVADVFGKRRRILVVDDSFSVRRFVQTTFEQHGYDVDVAQNGWQAFAQMQSRIYDFVFLDIEMPVMNGYRCTQAIREWEAKVQRPERQVICALTSHATDDERDLGIMLGMNLYESKPARPRRLLDIVDMAVKANDSPLDTTSPPDAASLKRQRPPRAPDDDDVLDPSDDADIALNDAAAGPTAKAAKCAE